MLTLSRFFAAFALFFLLLSGARVHAQTHPGEARLVREVAADTGKDPAKLTALLDGAQKQQSILDAISRPAESKSWKQYRPIFLTGKRIQDGIDFYREHRALIDATAKKYGVAPQYMVAIIGVETSYGGNTGHYKVLDALVTLAFYYPPRAKFFRSELKTLLELPDTKLGGALDSLTGSYAGAQGWGQFMPSSIGAYAVDADQDGHTDLHASLPDILASVANYFHVHGWQPGGAVVMPARAKATATKVAYHAKAPVKSVESYEARGYAPAHHVQPGMTANMLTLESDTGTKHWFTFQNFYVITRYNHSPLYAMAVTQLAQAIAAGVHDPATAEAAP